MLNKVKNNSDGRITDYGYDNANRLTSLDNKKSDTTTILANYGFTLDANGNRTQVVQNEPLTLTPNTDIVSYTYNTKKNRLMTANTISFGYDNEGQLWSKDIDSYVFDEAHRLTYIYGGFNIEYSYDGAGNRLRAIRDWSYYTYYVYDAGGNLLAEVDDSRGTFYYIHGLGLMAMVTPANQVYTYHFNAVGSTIAMTDSGQNTVNKYSYDPFGNILNQVEAVQQPFKFVGQYGVMTEPNGFYYMRARYYDPEVGRFISEDPKGFEGGDTNLFVYAANNPILLFDPLGLAPGDWWDPIVHPINFYNRAYELRSWGHETFPDKAGSESRHYVVSHILTEEYGSGWARTAGIVNEVQGIGLDILNLPSRLEGDSPWAFQWQDIVANEMGIQSAIRHTQCK